MNVLSTETEDTYGRLLQPCIYTTYVVNVMRKLVFGHMCPGTTQFSCMQYDQSSCCVAEKGLNLGLAFEPPVGIESSLHRIPTRTHFFSQDFHAAHACFEIGCLSSVSCLIINLSRLKCKLWAFYQGILWIRPVPNK